MVAVLVGAGCSATVADPGPPATAVAPETAPVTAASEAPEAAPAGSGVDLILTGGLIVTMTEPAEAQAIAIDGDRIVAVGDEATVAAMASEDTSVVDLEGRVVFPGFIDAHAHWYQPDRIGDYGPEQINQVLLSRGWTGTDDANVEPHFAELLFGWHRDGRIDLRMNAYLSINTPGTDLDRYGDWFTAYGIEPGSTVGDRLRILGVKIFIGSDWDRVAKWTEEELVDAVAGYHEAGWQIAAKQISDESLDLALAAFEPLHREGSDRRHRLEHALELRPDQIPRVAAAGLVPVVQLGGIEADLAADPAFQELIADDGTAAVWPFRDMLDGGLPVVGSTAANPVEGVRSPFTISVMQMLHGAVTGVSEVGNEPWGGRADQLMTIDEALETITARAAWVTFEEDTRGALAAGMLADLVVMSGDLRAARDDPAVLRAITVDATVVGGELLWCGFGLDGWCGSFGQPIPERLLDPSTLTPLVEGDLGAGAGPADGELTATASASRDVHLPGLALDGVAGGESYWSSGADAPGWIQVDFAEPRTLAGLRFTVFQNPPGKTVHVLELRVGGRWSEAERFAGRTATGDVLEWSPQAPVGGVSGFRVTTVESPSWPEWYEIEILP